MGVLKNLCHNDQMIQFGSLSGLLDGIPLPIIQDASARAVVGSRANWGDCADKTPLQVATRRAGKRCAERAGVIEIDFPFPVVGGICDLSWNSVFFFPVERPNGPWFV